MVYIFNTTKQMREELFPLNLYSYLLPTQAEIKI